MTNQPSQHPTHGPHPHHNSDKEDARDVLQRQRQAQLQQASAQDDGNDDDDNASAPTNAFPATLVRRYEVVTTAAIYHHCH
jgi:hypothetical protein